MTAIKRAYDPSVLSSKIQSMKLSDKDLVELTKKADPEGVGISLMTGRRIKKGENIKLEILCLVTYALGITPESTFKKVTK